MEQDQLNTPLQSKESLPSTFPAILELNPLGNQQLEKSDSELERDFKLQIQIKKMEHKKVMALRKKVMDPRGSFQVYPRLDSEYRLKRSLNFDMVRSEIFLKRYEDKRVHFFQFSTKSATLLKWVACALIGFFVGIIAFLMARFEDFLIQQRNKFTEDMLDLSSDFQWKPWAVLAGWSFGLCAFASYLTVFVGPGANGSGIAELMAYLNGVNYPNLIGWKTYFVKMFCVILGIAGGLCIGKEGPLAHIGACTAIMVIYYTPIKDFDYFKNDSNKREMVCAGISAGVSAAFGAPIGGALFSFELSKSSTSYWSFAMLWRTFFCCSVSTFTLSFLNQVVNNGWQNLELSVAGTLKFGDLGGIQLPLSQIYGAVILGIMGGCAGALFITVGTYTSFFRKKFVNTPVRKIVETAMFGTMTVSTMYLLVTFGCSCKPLPDEDQSHIEFNHWNCGPTQYNPLATLFFNTEADIIKSLFIDSLEYRFEISDLILFSLTWYFFTILTYGTWCPAGLFLPGIIMGGAMGRLYTAGIQNLTGHFSSDELLLNALLGAAAMLSGYCRLTYSLTVLMLETTQSIDLFVPVIVTMLSSYATGLLFNQSLYTRALRSKQVPLLKDTVPKENENLLARMIMKPNPLTLECLAKVEKIGEALACKYSSFPVKNKSGQLVGMISSNFLVILLQNKAFYKNESGLNIIEEVEQEDSFAAISQKSAGNSVYQQVQAVIDPNLKPLESSLNESYNREKQRTIVDNQIQMLMSKKQSLFKNSETDLVDYKAQEKETLYRISRMERRGSELDTRLFPAFGEPLSWRKFNSDLYSTQLGYNDVKDIVNECAAEYVDLRPYMVHSPFVCHTTDKIQKVLDIYRLMNLRQICVVNPVDGSLQGVISRENLFNYMSL